MRIIKSLALFAVGGLLAGAGLIYAGLYHMGADEAHWPLVSKLIATMRDRSVAMHSRDVVVPALDNAKLVAEGAGHYAAMCSGCHLAPGIKNTEIRAGLYPQPPNLSRPLSTENANAAPDPARQFWIIKHGLKMTAMPAWGTTHDDQSIWAIVAFLQKLPGMNAPRYKRMTASGGRHGHSHGHEPHTRRKSGQGNHHHDATAGSAAPAAADPADATGTPAHRDGAATEAEKSETEHHSHDHPH